MGRQLVVEFYQRIFHLGIYVVFVGEHHYKQLLVIARQQLFESVYASLVILIILVRKGFLCVNISW